MKIVDLSKSEHVKILRDLIFDEKLLHISSPDFIKYFENCYCYLIDFYERSKKNIIKQGSVYTGALLFTSAILLKNFYLIYKERLNNENKK